jgi:hypothetical protein
MTWDYPALGSCGGSVGAMVGLVHNLSAIFSDHFGAASPFRHVLTDFLVFAAIGAILVTALAAVYRLFIRSV